MEKKRVALPVALAFVTVLNAGFLEVVPEQGVFGVFGGDQGAFVQSSLDTKLVEVRGAAAETGMGGTMFEESLFASGESPFEGDGEDSEFQSLGEGDVFAHQTNPFFPPGEDVDDLGLRHHIVQPGDTPSSVAKRYGVTVETMLSANELRYGDYITPGEILIVLPVSGLLHKVRSGDTVANLAELYKASFDEIVSYNLLPADGETLPVGEYLVVPGGKKYIGTVAPAYGTGLASYSDYYVFPTTGRNWGRLHVKNAVDIANSCGTEVYAAASGKVTEVHTTNSSSRSAYGGYGNNIVISHPNGTKTRYAHLLTALIQEGDEVSKGSLIAWMGGRPYTPGAGNSTGCHLHFEVLGAKNPFIR